MGTERHRVVHVVEFGLHLAVRGVPEADSVVVAPRRQRRPVLYRARS